MPEESPAVQWPAYLTMAKLLTEPPGEVFVWAPEIELATKDSVNQSLAFVNLDYPLAVG